MKKTNFSLFETSQNNLNEVLEKIYNCIKITIGPTGKNGMVSVNKRSLKILTNGSFLMKHLEFPQFSGNVLAKLLEQASLKTAQVSGDGSTTTLLFTCEFLKQSFYFLSTGYNSVFLSNGFKKFLTF